MNVTQKGIITLIKSAIMQRGMTLPEGFNLEEAYPLVQNHHIAPLICDGAMRCGINRKSEVMGKLLQDYFRAQYVSEKQMEQVDCIFHALDDNKIDYMPLKGCKLKSLYPKPELRVMGDADILIRVEQYKQIKPIMHTLGFVAKRESDHELVWQNKNLYLELHKRIMPTYNKVFYAELSNGWQLAKSQNGTRYSMTPEDEFIFLFAHFAKHYQDGGIGCRHVVDLWIFLKSHPELDQKQLVNKLARLKLLEFYNNITQLIAVWFEDAAANEKTEFIGDFIFSSGSWGVLENRVIGLSMRTEKFHGSSKIDGKLQYIWRRLFPDIEEVKGHYPILLKSPWLLPIVWIWRLISKVLVPKDGIARQIKMIAALKPENISSRQEALNYVGLDFQF